MKKIMVFLAHSQTDKNGIRKSKLKLKIKKQYT